MLARPSAWVAWEGTMPLSEHEKRQLAQIEEALRAGDPWFADAVHAPILGCTTNAGSSWRSSGS
jgi:hypothetical protein